MRWFLRILILLCLVVAAIYSALVYYRPMATVRAAWLGTATNAVPGTLTVMAERTQQIRSEVAGRIESSNVKLGAEVKAGDILVQIDTTDLRIEIEQTESDLVAARRQREIGSPVEAELAGAREALRISESDFQRGSVPQADVDQKRRTVGALEQRIEIDRNTLDQRIATLEIRLKASRTRLERMSITASIDGTITQEYSGVGDLINSGSVIAEITSRQRLVEVKVSEENIASLKPGLKAAARFLPYPDERFDAVVDKILPPTDAATQRYRVFINVDIPLERLLPGMTGEANVAVEDRENALIIPRSALQGDQVFVVRNRRVSIQKVTVGFQGLNDVEVTSGLSEGDLVIVDDLDLFRPGDRVRVRELK